VLVTKDGVALSETAEEFFDFATSSAANEIITAAGVVPAN
jgi:phosphate transport system substrate-binding protein